MTLAKTMGTRSRCTRGKIGCILVSEDNQVVSASYVGPPPNFGPANQWNFQESTCEKWCERAQPGHEPQPGYVDCVSSHAEMNAIARADFSRLEDGTAYVNGTCCIMCSKALAASGVARVVMIVYPEDAHRAPADSIAYLKNCNIVVTVIEP